MIYSARTRVASPVATYRTLDQPLAEADVVSLHLPLGPEILPMIGANALKWP